MQQWRRHFVVIGLAAIGLLIAGALAWNWRVARLDIDHRVEPWTRITEVESKQLQSEYQEAITYYKAEDYAHAIDLLLPMARVGVVEAQYLIGRSYALGYGVEKDLSRAETWIKPVIKFYRAAAMEGNTDAQFRLGDIYLDTLGIDEREAYEWTIKAAVKGHAGAQYNLSKFYGGEKGTKIPKEKLHWLRIAAESGNAEAQYELGYRLAGGKGVDRDAKQARIWLERAAGQKYLEAVKALEAFGLTTKN